MEWKSISRQRRFKRKRASWLLSACVRTLVKLALQLLVSVGRLDSFGRKIVCLKCAGKTGCHVYRILALKQPSGLVGEGKSDFGGGLFIARVAFGSNGAILSEPKAIQLPSNAEFVSRENIYLLRGIYAREIFRAVREIRQSRVMSEKIREINPLMRRFISYGC